jgi:hypothetical protein
MRREDLYHVVAAAAQIVGESEFVVVGSQAIEKAIDIEGALGDGSHFQQAFGYYAHAVGPETAKAPLGWEDRLVVLEIPARPASQVGAMAFCLEPHDLVLSKLAANRERDWEFAKEALDAELVESSILRERVAGLPVDSELLESLTESLEALLHRRP